jgi:hypothetical protein
VWLGEPCSVLKASPPLSSVATPPTLVPDEHVLGMEMLSMNIASRCANATSRSSDSWSWRSMRPKFSVGDVSSHGHEVGDKTWRMRI